MTGFWPSGKGRLFREVPKKFLRLLRHPKNAGFAAEFSPSS